MNRPELLTFLCEDPDAESAATIYRWMTESRRFRSFAAANRSKIRKKLRTASTAEALKGVLLELEVARRFVDDRRCRVEYERYGQGRVRSPDLTLTFRERTIINLEVTLCQRPSADPQTLDVWIKGLVCQKLGQMVAQDCNVLVVASGAAAITIEDLSQAMKRLKSEIERRDGITLSRCKVAHPSDFFNQYQWLSGILLWDAQVPHADHVVNLWANPQTRNPLTAELTKWLTDQAASSQSHRLA